MFLSRITCIFVLAHGLISCSAENTNHAYEFAKKAAIGTVAGTAEICINSPLIYFKNTLQQPGAIISPNPKDWYRGFGMNCAAMGPTTAMQTGINAGLEGVIPGADMGSKIMRAFIAGALSATVNAPVELAIIHQQKNKTGAMETVKTLLAHGGKRVITRGWVPTGIREGAFTTGYLVAFPLVEEAIKNGLNNSVNIAMGTHATNGIAYVGAGAITGLTVAGITHPCDTIKTRMQVDYTRMTLKNMRDATRVIYAERGFGGFFSGVAPRAVRAGLAIPLLGTIQKKLSAQLDNSEK
jgi:hypothetical protein